MASGIINKNETGLDLLLSVSERNGIFTITEGKKFSDYTIIYACVGGYGTRYITAIPTEVFMKGDKIFVGSMIEGTNYQGWVRYNTDTSIYITLNSALLSVTKIYGYK